MHKSLEKKFGIDIRALAFTRICLALIVLYDLFNRARDLNAHYTDFGILPRIHLLTAGSPGIFSLHFASGIWQMEAVFFLCAAVAALMLLFGYRTRLASILSWLFIISLQARNPMILQGGDQLLKMLLFWGMFLPWGAKYSWDAAFRQLISQGKRMVLSFGTAGFLIQTAMVYFFTVIFKDSHEWFVEGSAIYYALNMDQFTKPFGYFLLNFPEFLRILSFSVWWLEALVPLFLFFPFFTSYTRTVGALGIIGLHLGLFFSMNLGPFPWVSMTSMIAFLPSPLWDVIAKKMKTPARTNLTIFYDQECGFCKKAAHLIKTFFLFSETIVRPAADNPVIQNEMMTHGSWIVVDHNGRHHKGYRGWLAIMRASHTLWILAPLFSFSPIQAAGNRIYRLVASHRLQVCAPEIPQKPQKTELSFLANVCAGSALVLVISINISGLPKPPFMLPRQLTSIVSFFSLDQRWNMFSPAPPKEDGWLVMPATLQNGTTTDVFQKNTPVRWEKPASVAATYRGERWRKYLMNLQNQSYHNHRIYYAEYLCRSWNRSHHGEKAMREVSLVFMKEKTLPDNAPPTVSKEVLLTHQCP